MAAHVSIVGGGVVGCMGRCYGGRTDRAAGGCQHAGVSGDMYVVVTVCGAKRAEGLIDSYVSRQDE